ncbi:MAG: protein phosphatase CheZ [Burkholderiales bacterium]
MVESQLLQMLIENVPRETRRQPDNGLMNGPVIQASGSANVVTSQQQADDVQESLEF